MVQWLFFFLPLHKCLFVFGCEASWTLEIKCLLFSSFFSSKKSKSRWWKPIQFSRKIQSKLASDRVSQLRMPMFQATLQGDSLKGPLNFEECLKMSKNWNQMCPPNKRSLDCHCALKKEAWKLVLLFFFVLGALLRDCSAISRPPRQTKAPTHFIVFVLLRDAYAGNR
jgi:hypothetical protein